MEWWYIARNGERRGPFDELQFRQLIESGDLLPDDRVWHTGLSEWRRAAEMPGLFAPPLPIEKVTSATTDSGFSEIPGNRIENEQISESTRENRSQQLKFANDQPANWSASYIVRHWRGELSLAQSYWVNSVLITIILLIAIKSVQGTIDIADRPTLVSLTGIAVWVIVFLVTPWQTVGLWRSASKHIRTTKKVFWPRVIQCLVIAGIFQSINTFLTMAWPQINLLARIAVGSDPYGRYAIRVLRQGTEIEVSGPIVFGLTDDIRTQLDANPNIRVIHLNSIGGRIGEARKLRNLISSRRLITYTSQGCASACVTAFLGGSSRVLREGAKLGFHRPALPGLKDNDIQSQVEIDKRLFLSAGIDSSFVDRAFSTPNSDLWTPSSYELRRARVITKVSDGSEFAMSEAASWGDSIKIESSLLEVPLFQKLKTLEPETFKKLLTQLQKSVTAGETKSQLFGKARQFVMQAAERSLPYAQDTALLDTVAVIVQELQQLKQIDGNLCYALLFPNQSPNVDLTRYLSDDVKRAELDALARVIESAATSSQKIPSEKEVEKQLARVFKTLAARYGDVSVLSKLEAPDVDRNKVCSLSIALYEEILTLPHKDSTKLLRYMFSAK